MRKHPIGIGEMTERIELQHKTLSDDGSGGASVSWITYSEEWAHIRPSSGGEREEAQRLETRSRYMVVIRHRSDVTDTDRVKWESRYLNVRFTKERGQRELFLELECEMGAPT